MSTFSKKLVNKIKSEGIKPSPRWLVNLLNILLWLSFFIVFLMGALSISLILRSFNIAPWEVTRLIGRSPVHSFFAILPYIWLLFLGLVFVVVNYLFKKTKNGYKYSPIQILIMGLSGSIALGLCFFYIKTDVYIERLLVESSESYERWNKLREDQWTLPNRGLLAGQILEVSFEDHSFLIEDFKDDKQWIIGFSELNDKSTRLIVEEARVIIRGKKINDDEFVAKSIHPWLRENIRPLKKRLLKNKIGNMKINN